MMMRADRLLSILMILQARGRVTARELAQELEVSERTIYRDIDALSVAGVPVYGEPGRDGGYALLDSYRTDLTGLTEGEAHALFMLGIPAPLADLGISQELKAALLKLSAALPEARRRDHEWMRQRVHLDSTWWHQGEEPVPHLRTIQQAVWQDRRLSLTYRPLFNLEMEQLVDPYGLVAKAGTWHLVCGAKGRVRVHRVSFLSDVRITDEVFERPPDFDLAAFWEGWCVEYEGWRSVYSVTVRIAPVFAPELPRYFGTRIREKMAQATPDENGWIAIDLSFESFEAARDRLISFGRGVEVIEPQALRRSVLDVAEQVVALYSNPLCSTSSFSNGTALSE
jgi:predicted DNA-binding transcriptional regulator YafY